MLIVPVHSTPLFIFLIFASPSSQNNFALLCFKPNSVESGEAVYFTIIILLL